MTYKVLLLVFFFFLGGGGGEWEQKTHVQQMWGSFTLFEVF